VTPEDTVFRALQWMLEEEVEHLPVIAGGKLVGICTRTDVLRTRRRQLESERREPGWKPLARGAGEEGATPAPSADPGRRARGGPPARTRSPRDERPRRPAPQPPRAGWRRSPEADPEPSPTPRRPPGAAAGYRPGVSL